MLCELDAVTQCGPTGEGHVLFISFLVFYKYRSHCTPQTPLCGCWEMPPEFGKLSEVKGTEALMLVRMIHKSYRPGPPEIGLCITFGPTCLSFCYLYSITFLGFLLITSSPSSKAYKSRMSQWLIFLGSSIRQSLEPNSSATGPRLPSCSEHGRAFSCNNRTGFRT